MLSSVISIEYGRTRKSAYGKRFPTVSTLYLNLTPNCFCTSFMRSLTDRSYFVSNDCAKANVIPNNKNDICTTNLFMLFTSYKLICLCHSSWQQSCRQQESSSLFLNGSAVHPCHTRLLYCVRDTLYCQDRNNSICYQERVD